MKSTHFTSRFALLFVQPVGLISLILHLPELARATQVVIKRDMVRIFYY